MKICFNFDRQFLRSAGRWRQDDAKWQRDETTQSHPAHSRSSSFGLALWCPFFFLTHFLIAVCLLHYLRLGVSSVNRVTASLFSATHVRFSMPHVYRIGSKLICSNNIPRMNRFRRTATKNLSGFWQKFLTRLRTSSCENGRVMDLRCR